MKHTNSNYIIMPSKLDFDEITLNECTLSKSHLDRQNPRPSTFYFVQSPTQSSSSSSSLDDTEEKTTDLNPPQSPLGSCHSDHSNFSFSRFFESINKSIASRNNRHQGNYRASKYEFQDKEKGFLYGHDFNDSHHHGSSHCGYFAAFIVGFVLLFSIFSLVLWIVSCHQKPNISLESIMFDKFFIQENGVDARGFFTSTMSINSSLKLNFRNTATFFDLHVTSIPLLLNYYQLPLATGNIPMFDQSKKSESSIEAIVKGSQIPLYGARTTLKTLNTRSGSPVKPVPLKLSVIVRSKPYVLGMLVTPNFYKKIDCDLIMDPKKMGVPIDLTNKCK